MTCPVCNINSLKTNQKGTPIAKMCLTCRIAHNKSDKYKTYQLKHVTKKNCIICNKEFTSSAKAEVYCHSPCKSGRSNYAHLWLNRKGYKKPTRKAPLIMTF